MPANRHARRAADAKAKVRLALPAAPAPAAVKYEAALGPGGLTPASEIRIFEIGVNVTEKGEFICDADDAAGIVDQWVARGTDLSWDYAHSETTENTTGLPRIAGAWSKLELREDGVWATEIQWTERCLQLIAAKEVRYWSPFFDVACRDHGGGLIGRHITNLINVGITNIPATHGIPAIAASATAAAGNTPQPPARASGRLTAFLAANQGTKNMTLAEYVKQMASDITKSGAKGDLSVADMVSLLGCLPADVVDDAPAAKPDEAPAADAADGDGPDSDDGPPSSEDDEELTAARAAVAAVEAKRAAAKNGPPTSRSAGVAAAQVALDAAKARKDGKPAAVATSKGADMDETAALRVALEIQKGRVDKIQNDARAVEFKNEIAAGVRAFKITPAQAANSEWLSIFDGSPSKVRKHVALSVAIVSGDAKAPGKLPEADALEFNAAETEMLSGLTPAQRELAKKHLNSSRAALAARRTTTETELAMALGASKQVNKTGSNPIPEFYSWPVKAGVHIYAGALVCIDSGGWLKPFVTGTGLIAAGVAQEEVDNTSGSNGDLKCKVATGSFGPFVITGITQADVGKTLLYATDDQTLSATATGRSVVGYCAPDPDGVLSTRCYVTIPGPGVQQLTASTGASVSSSTPFGPGTGAAGNATDVAASNHVHPPAEQEFRIQDAAASTATAETVIKRFQQATTISAIKFVADSSVTQSDTDYATITVKEGDGAGGARSTVVSCTSKTTAGKNLVAFTAVDLGSLTNAVIPAGGIVTLTVTKSGAGQALKGVFVLEFSLSTLLAAPE